jgi:hypothetical protein
LFGELPAPNQNAGAVIGPKQQWRSVADGIEKVAVDLRKAKKARNG